MQTRWERSRLVSLKGCSLCILWKVYLKPLKGLVKAFDPSSLQKAIMRSLKLKTSIAKSKIQSKAPPSKNTFQEVFTQSKNMPSKKEEETKNDLRWKKLCFTCKKPWEPGHKCLGRGQVHYIEVISSEKNRIEELEPKIKEEVPKLER